jgi:hypothetical protein
MPPPTVTLPMAPTGRRTASFGRNREKKQRLPNVHEGIGGDDAKSMPKRPDGCHDAKFRLPVSWAQID